MSVKLLIGLLLPVLLSAGGFSKPKTFSQAYNIYKKLDFDYTRTAFTDELYQYDPRSCMDKFYVKGQPDRKVVFVRIVPEEKMFMTRECGQKKICRTYKGTPFGGARCCREIDALYRSYDRDIFNIIPVVEAEQKRFTVPPKHIRGNIARVYLYMNAQYGLNLPYEEQMRYLQWHNEDAVDEKECRLHDQIVKIQGRSNPWIKSACETFSKSASKSSQR